MIVRLSAVAALLMLVNAAMQVTIWLAGGRTGMHALLACMAACFAILAWTAERDAAALRRLLDQGGHVPPRPMPPPAVSGYQPRNDGPEAVKAPPRKP